MDILRTPIYATDFGRYSFSPESKEVIIFPYTIKSSGYELKPESELKRNFPNTYRYLTSRRKDLLARKQYKKWYGFSAPRNLDFHDMAHIVVPLLANRGLYCHLPVEKGLCLMASAGFSITIDSETGLSPKYVLGLLNSRLLFWRLHSISNIFRGGWITCTKQYVGTLPIFPIDFSDHSDKARHDRIVISVEQIISLHNQLSLAKTSQEKTTIQRQIAATDQRIDRLVYDLYDLTDDEIQIVEANVEES